MDNYYHFTSCKNFYNIAQNGLIPQTGMRCQSIGDIRRKVFLSKGMEYLIVMFASMYNYYLEILGDYGNELIDEHVNLRNNYLYDMEKSTRHYEKAIFEGKAKEMDNYINMIHYIKNHSFVDYLEGPGYILSVSGLNINDTNPENCCYNDIIPPSYIKILYLVSKIDGKRIYSRDDIISFFMHRIPLDNVLNNVTGEYKDYVQKLYNVWPSISPLKFNPNEYIAKEDPIGCYDMEKQKEKTLVIC